MATTTPQMLPVRPARISRKPSPIAIEAINERLLWRPRFAPGHADPEVQKVEKAIREGDKHTARDLLILCSAYPRKARYLGADLELWSEGMTEPRVLAFPDASQTETEEQGEADATTNRVLCALARDERPTLDEIRTAKREAIEHRDALDDEIAALHALEVVELTRTTPSTKRPA